MDKHCKLSKRSFIRKKNSNLQIIRQSLNNPRSNAKAITTQQIVLPLFHSMVPQLDKQTEFNMSYGRASH